MSTATNATILDEDCTLQTCSLSQAQIYYVPSLPGNAAYLGLFAAMLVIQIGLGVGYRTWGFLAGAVGGMGLEVIGYVARVQMHFNPFLDDPFLMSTGTLFAFGPAFLSASIYLCLARIIVVFGAEISRFRPATHTITFISCDFISLLLQAIGGAIASSADTASDNQMGINIMIAGLATQVASLAIFMSLCAEFGYRAYRSPQKWDPAYSGLRSSLKFRAFLFALAFSTLTIFVRSCFRVAELKEGFNGKLANEEVTFMILEGAMILIACLALTICHPGVAFQGIWQQANFSFRNRSSNRSNIMGAEKSDEALGRAN